MKQQLTKALGQRIREIRLGFDMTQREFAEKMSMSNTYMCDLEAGRTGPGFYFFHQAGKIHGINPLYLLFGQEPKLLAQKTQQEKKENGPPTSEKTTPADRDFGENTAQVEQMLYYLSRSPVSRFAVLGFFSKYLIENKEVIEEDMGNQTRQGNL